jgi:iron complex outermembrane receptor protein
MKKTRLLYAITFCMKFIAIQLFLSATFTFAAFAKKAEGQGILDKPITLDIRNEEVKNVITEIKRKSEVEFIYSSNSIQANRKVSIKAVEKKLKDVLDEIFGPLGIGYKVVNEQVLLYKIEGNKMTVVTIEQEPEKKANIVTGTVAHALTGEPLVGATVAVKGKKRAVTTNNEGKFSIEADPGDVLVISSVGYLSYEVTVSTETTYTVRLTVSDASLGDVTIIGSRSKPRTNVDRPVPVDVISNKELTATGQIDIGQALHFSAPSFSAQKFGINDLSSVIDPASLRGLGSDQTLLLVNGKRRHKVAFFSINQGVSKGQVGNDINAIPAEAVSNVEILRDGAAAQYGSDAIAGVMNYQLNNSRSGGSLRFYTGIASSNPKHDNKGANANLNGQPIYKNGKQDNETYKASLNFGLPWGSDGFINTTINIHQNEAYSREGKYKASRGWYTSNTTNDSILILRNGINLNRAVLGGAENTNVGIFINTGKKIDDNWNFYAFGGYSAKTVVAGIFSRPPSLASRRVLQIFPDGYNPITPTKLKDYMLVAGVKGRFGKDWNLDFSAGHSGNIVDLYAENTVNPSMDSLSPTKFYTGGLAVTQTTFNTDISKTFSKTTWAVGSEVRFESFEQKPGQAESYLAGARARTGSDVGSSGREGFGPQTEGRWTRRNVGFYTELEHDFSKSFLMNGAIRWENYSDFGSDFSYKLAARYKVGDRLAIRGSVNRSFRAPSIAQLNYSNFTNITFDNAGNTIYAPTLPIRNQLVQDAFGFSELKPETSIDFALGLTSKINNNFSVTLDVYQIKIADRILLSQPINASLFPAFTGTNYNQVNVFLNAYDTKTKGLDFVAAYKTSFSSKSKLNLNLAFNLNKTEIDKIQLPSKIVAAGIDYNKDPGAQQDIIYFTKGTPTNKFIASANYECGKFSFLLRATRFGKVSDPLAPLYVVPTDPNAIKYQVLSVKTLTDLSLTFKPHTKIIFSIGVNNLFDVYPDLLDTPQTADEVIYSRRVNQFGTLGRFLNFGMNYNF